MYYLNTNAQRVLYQKIVNNQIFVDKSLLIEEVSKAIGTGNPYICITRPRIQKAVTATRFLMILQSLLQNSMKSI